MIDTDKYEGHYKASWANQYGDVVKFVYPNESSPSLDADQRLIIDAPLLLEEVKRLRIIETAAQLYGDYCKERHHQMDDAPFSFERWLDWMLVDDELGKMLIHYDQEALDDMKSKATYYSPKGCGFFTDYSKLKEMIE